MTNRVEQRAARWARWQSLYYANHDTADIRQLDDGEMRSLVATIERGGDVAAELRRLTLEGGAR